MRYALVIAALILFSALAGGFWLDAKALVPRWDIATELQVQPATKKLVIPLGTSMSFELHGQGISEGTRAWLVPETSQQLSQSGTFSTWGNPFRLRKVGNIVYVANARNGVLALDLSDWKNPHLLGGRELPGQAFDLEVVGTTLFVASGSAGLHVIDFKDPQAPAVIGWMSLPGAMALHLQGDRLYVAAGKAGLVVVDISNPSLPRLLGRAATPGPALDITVVGKSAFLACGHSGVAHIDISSPRNPRPLASIPRPGSVRGLESSGSIVYVGSFNTPAGHDESLLAIFDCSDALKPRLLAEETLSARPLTLHIHQQQLIIAQGGSGVSVFDLTNPAQPILRDLIESPGVTRGAIAEGDWVLTADGTGFMRTTRRDSQLTLPIIGRIANSIDSPPLLQDDFLFLPRQNNMLGIFDVNDPSHPEWISDLALPGEVEEMAFRDDLLFISISLRDKNSTPTGGRLLVVSLREPTHPKILASSPFATAPRGISLQGNRLLMTLTNHPLGSERYKEGPNGGRLVVLDLADPNQPIILYELALELTPVAMAWQDGHAFIVMEEGKLLAVLASPQRQPAVVGELEFPWMHQGRLSLRGSGLGGGRRGGITLIGEVAAVHLGVTELSFVNIAVPSRLVLHGTIETPGFISQMAFSDHLLYATILSKGVAVYNLDLPWQPRHAGMLRMPWALEYISFNGPVLWHAGRTGQFLTCIPTPQLVETRTDVKGQNLTLKLPKMQTAGNYSLWIENNDSWQEIPNCVEFIAR